MLCPVDCTKSACKSFKGLGRTDADLPVFFRKQFSIGSGWLTVSMYETTSASSFFFFLNTGTALGIALCCC